MKYIFLFVLLVGTTLASGQNSSKAYPSAYIGESEHYEFYSHFGFNMHHFFQQEALTNKVLKKTKISQSTLSNLSNTDKKTLNKVIKYYRDNMIEKDLRTSDYMSDFRGWIITQNTDKFSNIPPKFKEHISKLQAVKKIYKDNFWKEHNSKNKKVLKDNLKFIKNTEKAVVKKLTNLTRAYWQSNKIRVDIVIYASSSARNMRNRPYTSLFPTHVVMNSAENADKPFGNWLELFYHESSHHLISSRWGFVGGTILDVAKSRKQKSLRQLWHSYLFYFSGKVTQEALKSQGIENYELYMKRNKVFALYIPYLDKHLPDYMNQKKTLKDVTESIFQDFNEDRK